MKPTISKPFKSNDRTFDKVYNAFDKRDYFNSQGLAKTQIGNFERALQKNDKGAQQVLDLFKGDEKKAKDYITQVISDRNKERAFNNYKALKSAVDSIQKGKPNVGAVDYVKRIIHNSSQKYSIALYSTLRNKKFTKWKDVHDDIDSLVSESVNEAYVVLYSPKKGVKPVTTAAYKDKKDAEKWAKDLGGITMIVKKKVKGIDEGQLRKIVREIMRERAISELELSKDDMDKLHSDGEVEVDGEKVTYEEFNNLSEKEIKGKHAGNYVKRAPAGRTIEINGVIYTSLGKGKWKGPDGKKLNWIEISAMASALGNKKVVYKEGKKRYYQQDRVGSAKYTISYHDGKKKHKDGSDFFDIQTFKNKKDLAKFVNTLHKGGYVYGFNESVNEGISVFDERHFGKKGIIIMIDDNGKKVSAIFKDKKNADKFNRNNPSDIKKLLQLAKSKKFPQTIDESILSIPKSELTYQLSIDYTGRSKPKITTLNKRFIEIMYGYKINPNDVIKSLKKVSPDTDFKHMKWSPKSSGGGHHRFAIKESVNEDKNEIEGLVKKVGKNETKFYDILSTIEKKYGKRKYRIWLEKSLKDFGENPKHYDYRTNAAAEEKLFQLAK